MANEVTFDQANGLAKDVYAKGGVKDFLPKVAQVQRDVPFETSAKLGDNYKYPVVAKPPNGVTRGGAAGGVTALKSPRNMVIKQAEISPYEMILREQVAWAALSRLAAESEASFAKLQTTMQMAMKRSLANHLEANFLLGQRPLGVVDAGGITDLGGNLLTCTITADSWRPGLWSALDIDCTLDAFTSTTKNNASGPLIVKGINRATRTLTLQYTGTAVDEIDPGDLLFFEGAYADGGATWYEAPGLMTQAAHVSGVGPTGLNVSTYPSLQGNAFALNGPFSTEVAESIAGDLRDRGAGESGKILLLLSNKTYGEIANEVRANSAIQISYNPNRQKFGQKHFVQETKDGEIEYVSHPFMSWGEAFGYSPEDCVRGGSTDITPTLPGTDGEKLWRLLDGYTAAEMLMYSDQFILHTAPARSMVVTGITHT